MPQMRLVAMERSMCPRWKSFLGRFWLTNWLDSIRRSEVSCQVQILRTCPPHPLDQGHSLPGIQARRVRCVVLARGEIVRRDAGMTLPARHRHEFPNRASHDAANGGEDMNR